ncbi:MAG: adenylosuccinate synthase [Deltaproteobacteria bacterium]|jgi:adenylosuccinate synthase|nr:adenylosuccinate synthase [Deltaproteobacteria bacterium]
MTSAVVIGTQWGDEGKGKIVDLLTEKADVVVRFQGGANAGHTLVVGGETYALHLVPSGILRPEKMTVIASGVVVDPEALIGEIEALRARGVRVSPDNLKVSDKAHLIFPYHKALDGARERPLPGMGPEGTLKIGTTGRGIGPAYEDKASRKGLRMADLLHPESLREKLGQALMEKNALFTHLYGLEPVSLDAMVALGQEWGQKLAPFIRDSWKIIQDSLARGLRILFEGAQGTQLDIDHGTYPYVTSSSTVSGGASTGAGVAPALLGKITGLVKAYSTRVGEGPFPTELLGAEGERLREVGHEYGATTGRPRRCGWLDCVVARAAAALSGLTWAAVTKLDVLAGFSEIKMAVAYRLDGEELLYPPSDIRDLARVEPVYRSFPGFAEDISGARALADLPRNCRVYLEALEEAVGVPLGLVSVGPERDETIVLGEFF